MKTKKIVSLVLCLIMAMLMMIGCNSDKDNVAESNIVDIMKTAQEKLAELKSMSYEMNMELEMGDGEQSLNIEMNGKGDYIVDPATLSMDITLNMGEMGSMETKAYMEQKDGEYIMYTGIDAGTGSLIWSSQKMENMDAINQYNAQASMDMYISCSDSFAEKGTETINGSETSRYDGTISKEALNKVMTESGVLGQFTSLGVDEKAMESVMTDMGDIPISVWVEKNSGLPVQYEMDMTNVMQNMMKKIMESMDSSEEISVGKVFIKMTITNTNNVENITIPEEALNSKQ